MKMPNLEEGKTTENEKDVLDISAETRKMS
jgi:hypothetical protein